MTTKLKVIDVAKIPGRADVMAVVEFVEGYLVEGCNHYIRSGTTNVWRITTIGTHPPENTEEKAPKRLPLGLLSDGNDELSIGDILECSNCKSVASAGDSTTTTP